MDSKKKKIFGGIFDTAQGNLDGIIDVSSVEFDTAIVLWEYSLEYYSQQKNLDKAFVTKLTVGIFDNFCKQNISRAVKAIFDNSAIKKAIFTQANMSISMEFCHMCVGFILTAKADLFAETTKMLSKNTALSTDYGEIMERILEETFIQSKAKNGKITFTKKQIDLIDNAIKLISSSTRPKLEQRMREIL